MPLASDTTEREPGSRLPNSCVCINIKPTSYIFKMQSKSLWRNFSVKMVMPRFRKLIFQPGLRFQPSIRDLLRWQEPISQGYIHIRAWARPWAWAWASLHRWDSDWVWVVTVECGFAWSPHHPELSMASAVCRSRLYLGESSWVESVVQLLSVTLGPSPPKSSC